MGEVERMARWPAVGEPGRFEIRCSCQRWSFTGTAPEIHAASREHDDSPWRQHVVVIWGRVIGQPQPLEWAVCALPASLVCPWCCDPVCGGCSGASIHKSGACDEN